MPNDEYESLKKWLEVMELRQSSLENRQVTTDNLINDLSRELKEHKALTEELRITANNNTQQLIQLNGNVKPILDGIANIENSVRFLGHISTGLKWITTTVLSITATVYMWIEYISHFFQHGGK